FEASCSGPPPSTTTCVEFDNSDGATAKAVTLNITASGSDDVWWWANFTNFNEGISTTTTRTLQTNSVLA
ncbi:MAG: hypothetical protein KAT35_06065, partial [Candidatus Aenigmarchaeota archaeon]|nr:hypothetical protein [Candidatus Aenigmarchaeota archaeon]